MVDLTQTPKGVRLSYDEYIKSGRWKCEPSPTGAHHWVEDETGTGIFTCKYCRKSKKLPMIYTTF